MNDIISTESALAEKNRLRAKLNADIDSFLGRGGVMTDASGVAVNRSLDELSNGRRKTKNNSSLFARQDDTGKKAKKRRTIKKITDENE